MVADLQKYIRLVEGTMMEARLIKNDDSEPWAWANPSRSDIAALLQRFDLRGVVAKSGVVVVWDSFQVIHSVAVRWLADSGIIKWIDRDEDEIEDYDSFVLSLDPNFVNDIDTYDGWEDTEPADADGIYWVSNGEYFYLSKNPNFKRMLGI